MVLKYVKSDKTRTIKGRTYRIYFLGKWQYVRYRGEYKPLSTVLRHHGIKPY